MWSYHCQQSIVVISASDSVCSAWCLSLTCQTQFRESVVKAQKGQAWILLWWLWTAAGSLFSVQNLYRAIEDGRGWMTLVSNNWPQVENQHKLSFNKSQLIHTGSAFSNDCTFRKRRKKSKYTRHQKVIFASWKKLRWRVLRRENESALKAYNYVLDAWIYPNLIKIAIAWMCQISSL